MNEEEDEDDYMNMVIVEPEKPKGRETYTQRRIRKEREVVHSLSPNQGFLPFIYFLSYNSVDQPFLALPICLCLLASARLLLIFGLFVCTISEGLKNGSLTGEGERGIFLAMILLSIVFLGRAQAAQVQGGTRC